MYRSVLLDGRRRHTSGSSNGSGTSRSSSPMNDKDDSKGEKERSMLSHLCLSSFEWLKRANWYILFVFECVCFQSTPSILVSVSVYTVTVLHKITSCHVNENMFSCHLNESAHSCHVKVHTAVMFTNVNESVYSCRVSESIHSCHSS